MNALAQAFAQMPAVGRGVYAPADFEAVRDIIYDAAGIVLPPGKAMLVYSRLAPLVRNSGCATFGAYVALIGANDGERHRTVCALTTNHTFFFREDHHFTHLAETVRPALIRRAVQGKEVRVWSAGCSSGEETWSIVMTLLGADRAAAQRLLTQDLRVLATDLADHALIAAQAACYDAKAAVPVPADLRKVWMRAADGGVTMTEEARSIVRFLPLNLLTDWPLQRLFDVIFCRNVMIYFDQPTKERLVQRFAEQLKPGGYLYIGHSERVTGPAEAHLRAVGPTIYRREDRP